jgi:hypothetical protein
MCFWKRKKQDFKLQNHKQSWTYIASPELACLRKQSAAKICRRTGSEICDILEEISLRRATWTSKDRYGEITNVGWNILEICFLRNFRRLYATTADVRRLLFIVAHYMFRPTWLSPSLQVVCLRELLFCFSAEGSYFFLRLVTCCSHARIRFICNKWQIMLQY